MAMLQDRGRLASPADRSRLKRSALSPLDLLGVKIWARLWPFFRPIAVTGLWLTAVRARAIRVPCAGHGDAACLARAVAASGARMRLSEMCRGLAMARGWAVAEADPARRSRLIMIAGLILAQRRRGVRICLSYGGDIAAAGERLGPAFARLGVPLVVIEEGAPAEIREQGLAARACLCSLKSLGQDVLRDLILLGEPATALRLATRGLRGRTGPVGAWRRNPAVLLADLDRALLDEARVPMTAGGARDQLFTQAEAHTALGAARTLKEAEDFQTGLPGQPPTLTALGRKRLAARSGAERSQTEDPIRWSYLVTLAIMALHGVQRDRDYVVADSSIQIIDPQTGEPAPGRNWGSGVQQMIEALERVPMSPVQRSLAQISVAGVLENVPLLGGVASDLDGAERELQLRYGLRGWPARVRAAPGPVVMCRDRAAQARIVDVRVAEGATLVSDEPDWPGAARSEAALAGLSPAPRHIVLADVAETARMPQAISDRNAGCPVTQVIAIGEAPLSKRIGPRMLYHLWPVSPLRQLRARMCLSSYQAQMARSAAKQRAAQVDVETRRKRILAFSGRSI